MTHEHDSSNTDESHDISPDCDSESNASYSVHSPSNRRPSRPRRDTRPPAWMRDGEFVVDMVCRAMMNAVLNKQ